MTERASANGIEIAYETFGSPGGRPLLLVMGLGAQMIHWDEEFCGVLADAGHHVVRFDNRDVGESTHLHDAGTPVFGENTQAPYLLDDMADDAAGLMDALGWETAHVVGASMGGMIAQTLAIRHPHRVRSLTSIMSTSEPGGRPAHRRRRWRRSWRPPRPTARPRSSGRWPPGRSSGPPAIALDRRADHQARRAEAYDRSFDPAGHRPGSSPPSRPPPTARRCSRSSRCAPSCCTARTTARRRSPAGSPRPRRSPEPKLITFPGHGARSAPPALARVRRRDRLSSPRPPKVELRYGLRLPGRKPYRRVRPRASPRCREGSAARARGWPGCGRARGRGRDPCRSCRRAAGSRDTGRRA